MEFTAEMIAGLLGGTIVGDKSVAVHTVSSIEGGKKGALTYLTNPKYEQYIYTTEASIVLVNDSFEPTAPVAVILSADALNEHHSLPSVIIAFQVRPGAPEVLPESEVSFQPMVV